MERYKLTDEDKKVIDIMSISKIIRLHDEFGFCFECNDGSIEYSYTENAA